MARIVVPGQNGAVTVVEVDRELTVGRADDCDVVVAEPSVSSHHLVVSPGGAGVSIRDVGSTNGTFLNGERVVEPVVAHPGDHLRIGQAVVAIEAGATEAIAPALAPGGTVVAAAIPPSPESPALPPPPPPPPVPWRLVVRTGPDAGREVAIDEGAEITVGRGADASLAVSDPRVSSLHARVQRGPGGLVVTDLASANGTLVRGTRVTGSAPAQPGDEIQVGETVLVVFVGDAAPDAYAPTPTIIELTPSAGIAAADVEAIVRKRSRSTGVAVGIVGVVALAAVAIGAFVLSRGGGSDDEDTVPAVVDRNDDATVQIINVTDGGLVFRGSGSVIDRDEGLILTNNHVASGGELYVFSKDLDEEVEAELVAAAVCEDLAIIRIKDPDARDRFDQVQLAPAGSLHQGDLVIAMGYPGTAEGASGERLESLSVTSGVVAKVDVVYDVPGSGLPGLTSVVQHAAAVNPGNSGGPLFDSDGRQVGVNTAIFFGSAGRVEGANYAVTIGRVRELLDDMKDGYSPGWFGAAFEETAVVFGNAEGLLVLGVTPDSEAEDAGFVGATDQGYEFVVVAVDGEPVATLADYCDALPEDPEDVTLTVASAESGETAEVDVFIGRR